MRTGTEEIEAIKTMMFSAFTHGTSLSFGDSFSAWFDRNNLDWHIRESFSRVRVGTIHDVGAQYESLLKENQELIDALKSIKALIDDNTLVRNTKDDGLEGFAVRQLPLITALAKMQRALNKHEAQ